MQIILNEDVDHLGYRGDVVDVRKGYWRNYLRPKGLAQAATGGQIVELTARMERRRNAQARSAEEAQELRDLLNRTIITIPAHAADSGKLFGSVGPFDIARALESARKLRVDPKKVQLDEPIKKLGTQMVRIDVFENVHAEVKTIVTQAQATEDERAQMQAEAEANERKLIAEVEAAERAAEEAAAAEAAAADVSDEGSASADATEATSADA